MPYCEFVTHIWDKIGSGNGLFADSTKPLPEPMLTYHQYDKAISKDPPLTLVTKISLKIHSDLPGTNELKIGLRDSNLSNGC